MRHCAVLFVRKIQIPSKSPVVPAKARVIPEALKAGQVGIQRLMRDVEKDTG
jgi:hypothetical protein